MTPRDGDAPLPTEPLPVEREGDATSRWVDLDGPVHYLDFGGPDDGPVLVCVHGLGGSHVNWRSVGPGLAEVCRVYALDLAGHGRTPSAGRGTGVNANQRLLDRFLRRVSGTPVILVGNSMGGMISILQTDARPETVAGLVLIDPAIPLAKGQRVDRQVALAFAIYALPGVGEAFMARRRSTVPVEQVVREVLALCCVDPSRVAPEVVEESLALAKERAGLPVWDTSFLTAARSLLAVNARAKTYAERMRRIRVPVLLLHGEKDRLISLAAAHEAAQANPEWRFEVAPDVGHVPMLEAPEWTLAKISDWLAAGGAPAAAAARRPSTVDEQSR